jgi:DNA-binding PadR family transcriptional regulator
MLLRRRILRMHFGKRNRGCGPALRMRGGNPGHHAQFGDGFGHRGSGGGGGRRGKRFSGDELRLMVLGLLGDEAPQHGYQLIRAFAARSGDAYTPSPGVLYPLLTLLTDMGLVEETDPAGGARRSYQLTAAGNEELATKRALADAAIARLGAMAEEAGRTDAGPIRRAMMNLRTASMQRMSRDETGSDTAFAIAAIIDEAAQKIERLS